MYEVILMVSFSLGLFASVVLLVNPGERRLLNSLLATFTLSMALFSFLVFSIRKEWLPDLVFLIRTLAPLYYYLPAAIYLYARSYVWDEARLTRKDLWHGVPLLLHVLYSIPLVIDIALGRLPIRALMETAAGSASFFNEGPIPDVYHDLFRLSVFGVYLVLVVRLFLSRRFREYVRLNGRHYPHSIRWIRYFTVTSVLFSVFAGIVKAQVHFLGKESIIIDGNAFTIGMLLFYDMLIVYAMLNPVILFGLPYFRKVMGGELAETLPEDQAIVSVRASTLSGGSPLPHDRLKAPHQSVRGLGPDAHSVAQAASDLSDGEMAKAQRLIRVMNEYVQAHQPYREQEFNLSRLSLALKVPEHHLGLIFRHMLHKSFVEYRNELRVAHVMRLMDEGLARELTLEAIGLEAGFHSRATFFAVFKKQTGQTPAQYLKSPQRPEAPFTPGNPAGSPWGMGT
jgi:AraC-like DNA-binding protein